jgi:biopolymer transport protein ExbD
MNSRIKRKKHQLSGINVAPLIDVIFILVIFFMVSSTLIVHPGMIVNIPEAKTSEMLQKSHLVIYITKDNELFVNEEEVLFENLFDVVSGFIMATGNRDVTVNADSEIFYGEMIRVIDVCKEAGIENISFTTKPKED